MKVGPKRGLFKSCVTVGEGIVRVFRPWLAERSAAFKSMAKAASQGVDEDEENKKKLLWADAGKHVGLRIRVAESETTNAPILVRHDEDAPVSYTLQYEGELVVVVV